MTGISNQYIMVLNGALISFMIFFVIVVSPTVFKTLSQDEAARFLRGIFPRLFVFGLSISLVMVMFSLFVNKHDLISIFSLISVGFAVNCFVITPNINKARDAVLAGDSQKETQFKILHLLSVAIFVAQLCLSIFVLVTNIE